MPRNWQAMVDDLPDVQKLIHLSMRQDPYDVDRIRGELLRQRRRYYEAELTDQARRVGCPGQVGRLGNGAILSELNEMGKQDATSIVNTYNADLASAISYIRAEVPTANRYVYAKRLGVWEQSRASWKDAQIAQYTKGSARAKAQQDFRYNNNTFGMAVLEPTRAVCPICQGWINRGAVDLRIAHNSPPPYHPNCCPPGVTVSLSDKGTKRIEEISEGDSVMDCSGSTRVIQVHQRETREAVYRLFVGDRILRVTGDHPILTDHGWIPAQELRVGDQLITAHGDDSVGDNGSTGLSNCGGDCMCYPHASE